MAGNPLCRLGFSSSAAAAALARSRCRCERICEHAVRRTRASIPALGAMDGDESITIALPGCGARRHRRAAAAQVAVRLQPAAEPWVGVDAVAAHLACRRQRVYDLVCRRHVTGIPHRKEGAAAAVQALADRPRGSRAEAPHERRRSPSTALRLVSVPTSETDMPTEEVQPREDERARRLPPRRAATSYTYRVRGRQRWGTAATFDEARRRKRQAEADTERGELRDNSRVAFGEYAREWVAGYQGRTSHGLRESTRRMYRQMLEQRVIPYFDGTRRLRLAEIEPRDVKAFVRWMVEQEDPRRPGRLLGEVDGPPARRRAPRAPRRRDGGRRSSAPTPRPACASPCPRATGPGARCRPTSAR